MQQHPFQHRAIHYLPARGSLVPADGMENVGVGLTELSSVTYQEWDTNRDLDIAEHLRGSRILDGEAPPRRRVRFFPPRDAHSVARVLMVEEFGETRMICHYVVADESPSQSDGLRHSTGPGTTLDRELA